MLIKNTDGSYCKIKNIKVSGTKAYVTLVIYSSIPQTTQDDMENIHRVFSFYLRDFNSTELHRLSPNNYWIDRNNNYDSDSNNVDINMHKEIILAIDITNVNQSNMLENKWVRQCNIVMIDHTTTPTEAWVSEDLELISKEIELPTLSNLQILADTGSIILKFKYLYESQEDFNYINKNLVTEIRIKSIYSNEIIESTELPSFKDKYAKEQTVLYQSSNEYTEPVIIEILIKNLKDDILKVYSEFFNPTLSNLNITIKDSTTTKNVRAMHIKDGYIKAIKTITNK